MDLYSYLLRNRIVFLGGFVDFEMATKIVGSILALDALDSEEDIKLYINSPGHAFPCQYNKAYSLYRQVVPSMRFWESWMYSEPPRRM